MNFLGLYWLVMQDKNCHQKSTLRWGPRSELWSKSRSFSLLSSYLKRTTSLNQCLLGLLSLTRFCSKAFTIFDHHCDADLTINCWPATVDFQNCKKMLYFQVDFILCFILYCSCLEHFPTWLINFFFNSDSDSLFPSQSSLPPSHS